MKQASFLPKLRLDHGGAIREGKRKIARPFSHKHAIHVVLKSHRARGAWSLLVPSNERRVERLLQQFKRQYRIRVYRFINVGNHLHLLVKAEAKQYHQAKQDFQNFLRRFAGAVAFEVTGARKTQPQGGFWERLAYSRIIEWGRQYKRVSDYFTENFFESKGLLRGLGRGDAGASGPLGPPGSLGRSGQQDAWLASWLDSMIEAGVRSPA